MKKHYNSDIEKWDSISARAFKHYQGGHGCWFQPAPLTQDEITNKHKYAKFYEKELYKIYKIKLDFSENSAIL